MSLIKNEDVTVLGCWDICKGESSPRARACLCTASSTEVRLGEGGDEQPLSRSDRGLNSAGDPQSPLDTHGLLDLWERIDSIPKLDPFDTSIASLINIKCAFVLSDTCFGDAAEKNCRFKTPKSDHNSEKKKKTSKLLLILSQKKRSNVNEWFLPDPSSVFDCSSVLLKLLSYSPSKANPWSAQVSFSTKDRYNYSPAHKSTVSTRYNYSLAWKLIWLSWGTTTTITP